MEAPAQPKPASSAADSGGEKRQLGLIALTALVVGNMVGSGVFLLPSALAPFGGTSFLAWVVSAAGTMCFGLVIARLARRRPAVGGPYAYAREAFGEFAGFLVGWGYWISCWCGVAAVAVAMTSYLGDLVPVVAEYPTATTLAAIVLLTAVNARGVREAGAVQVVTTVLKLAPLLAVAVFGLARLEPGHFTPFNPTERPLASAVLGGLALTLWAYQGFESASVAAGEARDARRNVPRATLIGVAIATALYVASTLAVMGLVGPQALAGSRAPFADAARVLWGERAGQAVAAGAFVSCFGALNGWILVAGRMPLAIARDGLFPPFFARLSARGTPAVALAISSSLSCALVVASYSKTLVSMFTGMTLLATLSALVPYVFAAGAEMLFSARERRATGERAGIALTIGLCAFAYGLVTIHGAGDEYVARGFLLLLAGMPFYVLARARGSESSAKPSDPPRPRD
jgi:APA family basic amino acid/polyamine antiporter